MSAQIAPLAVTEVPDLATPITPAKPHIVPPAQPTSKKSRHARRCTVCHHKDLLKIEDDFLHWRPATEIAAEFALPDRRAVYRHARAAGLYRKRMRNMRRACSHIADHAERVTPNAKNVLDAVRICALIDDDGVLHEPNQRTIVEHINSPEPNVYSQQSESTATPTKQTPDAPANVHSKV